VGRDASETGAFMYLCLEMERGLVGATLQVGSFTLGLGQGDCGWPSAQRLDRGG
jgi:hypothetical protein